MDGDTERLDVVIFGASGFTGERVVRVAIRKQQQLNSFSFAIAGRSKEKLREVLDRAKHIAGLKDFDVKLIQADIKHPETIRQMCKQAKVLINCVGPYRFFGEDIVKTCVETDTHYVDISGEPEFLERMQLKYDQEAKNRGLYIVSACGFDSIPSEMGIAFTKHNFKGELDSVETFMSFKSGPAGTAVHYGTWESAVHGISSAGELPPIRKELFKERLPRSPHKIEQSTIKTSTDVEGYAIPFPGADRSVARRTEYLEFTEQQKRPDCSGLVSGTREAFLIQVISYLKTGSVFHTAAVILFGAIFAVLAKFKLTRELLLKYPKVFSAGLFSHEGPTEEQIRNTRFRMEIVGYGYAHKLVSPAEVHSDAPDQKIVVEVNGPEPGYAATSAFVFESAMTILEEIGQPKSRIPRPGVLPPGYAFGECTLIDRLREHGIEFKVVSQTL